MAGYSGTPLPQKLGIKPDSRVCLIRTPDTVHALLGAITESCESPNVVLAFCRTIDELLEAIQVRDTMARDAGLWICWPKRASKVPTEITEDAIRDHALPTGLVDNKVCAIDDTWSGLRLVWRKELR
jgi:hypothetical protein